MWFPSCSKPIRLLRHIKRFSPGRPLAASLITLAEIEYGMEVKIWGASRRDLMRCFLARFTPLLPDIETARVWARIKSDCEKKGRPITFADAWIAADRPYGDNTHRLSQPRWRNAKPLPPRLCKPAKSVKSAHISWESMDDPEDKESGNAQLRFGEHPRIRIKHLK
jgi:hypothetical protein